MNEETTLETVETTTEDAAVPTEETEATGPTLSIVDVRNAVNVIDFACNQGAFKGWEVITQVMGVRNNLNAFVQAVTPEKPEDEGSAESPESETPAE